MNRLLIILSLLINLSASAQTQQGYVKTLGRPDKQGEALAGVTIRAKGEHNAVISQDDGTFSMLMTGKKNGDAYALQQVQKSGYELNEKGVIGRQYAFSDKVPLTIVMVSTSQLQADKQRIENNAYQVAERNYKARQSQLEQQLNSNIITIEKYQEELRDLQDKFEKYQLLIDGLAEHYAHTDYDGLDEKDREINICIENGELDRADSLIRTLFDPIGVLARNKDALSRINQDVTQAQEIIEQANTDMAAVLRQQEKDAEYLYQLYTIAITKLDHEKARLYIETRAELDTTNVEWQLTAGGVMKDAADYEKAMMYNLRALAHSSKKPMYYNFQGTVLNNIGDILLTQDKYQEALAYFEKARDFDISVWGEQNEALVKVCNNIGLVYEKMENYSKALENYNKALEIESQHLPDGSKDLALLNNNIGGLYKNFDKRKAVEYLNTALELYKRFCGEQSSEIAMVYGNLADSYANTNSILSLQYVKKALDIYLRLYGENHPDVAWCYGIMGSAYYNAEQPQKGDEYINKSLAIYKSFYGEKHSRIGLIYQSMSALQVEKGNIIVANEYCQKALDIFISIYGDNHSTVASCYNIKGMILLFQDKPQEAAVFVDKAVSIMEQKYQDGHPDLYFYYLSQGAYRFGLFNKDLACLDKSKPLDGQMNDYGAEESFNKLLATMEKFYMDDSEKKQNTVQYLINTYFIRIALGANSYKEKLQSLSVKYPQQAKAALQIIQQQISQ